MSAGEEEEMRKGKEGSWPKLIVEEIEKLSDYCLQNAGELIQEAGILLKHKRYARSYALSVVAMEEISKRELLWEAIWLGDDKQKWEEFWGKFKSHRVKLSQMLKNYIDITISKRADTPRKVLDDYLSKVAKSKAKSQTEAYYFDRCKQRAFYVDAVAGKLIAPSQYIPRKTAQGMLKWAEHYLEIHRGFKPTREEVNSRLAIKNDMKEGENFIDYWYRKRGLIKP